MGLFFSGGGGGGGMSPPRPRRTCRRRKIWEDIIGKNSKSNAPMIFTPLGLVVWVRMGSFVGGISILSLLLNEETARKISDFQKIPQTYEFQGFEFVDEEEK